MTHRIGSTVYLCPEPSQVCELCTRKLETRPYGPNRAEVCFDCGMLDEDEAKRRFGELLDA